MRFQTIRSPRKNRSFELVLRAFQSTLSDSFWNTMHKTSLLNNKSPIKSVLCWRTAVEEQSSGSTCFVRVLCHPGYGDAADFRVTEAQQESSVGFGHQHVLSLLFIHKAKNRPGTYKHTNTWTQTSMHKRMFTQTKADRLLSYVYCSVSSWFVYKGLHDMDDWGLNKNRQAENTRES